MSLDTMKSFTSPRWRVIPPHMMPHLSLKADFLLSEQGYVDVECPPI